MKPQRKKGRKKTEREGEEGERGKREKSVGRSDSLLEGRPCHRRRQPRLASLPDPSPLFPFSVAGESGSQSREGRVRSQVKFPRSCGRSLAGRSNEAVGGRCINPSSR